MRVSVIAELYARGTPLVFAFLYPLFNLMKSGKMMKILIDASAIKSKVTGAGKYATHLILSLAKIDSRNQYIILLDESLGEEHPILDIQKYKNIDLKRIDIPAIGPKRQWLFFKKIRNKINYDVFHCLLSNYPLAMKKNGVATIYDLKYLLYPRFLGRHHLIKSYYMRFVFRHAVHSCRQVIAISNSTKKDMIETFNLSDQVSSKISIVYGASCMPESRYSPDAFNGFRSKYSVAEDYLLFVGEHRPHKNIDGLIEGYQRFVKKSGASNIPLVVVGIRHGSSLIDTGKPLHDGNGRIIFTDYIDDITLNELYRNAYAFLLPSHYEGFGLPIIEAMQHGTPVITSNVSSMPEVAGDAALLVDPKNPQTIADALSMIFNDHDLRKRMRKKSLQRAGVFTWPSAAERALSVYRKVQAEATSAMGSIER